MSSIEHTARKIALDYKNGTLNRNLLHQLLTDVQDADQDKDGKKTKFRAHAKAMYHSAGDMEFEDNAIVSLSEDNSGAYIQCWKFVHHEEEVPTKHTYNDQEVLSIDNDGCLILWDAAKKAKYNCGENLETYGISNLSEQELTRIMFCRGIHVISKCTLKKGKLTGGSRFCGMGGCTGKALAVRWEDKKLTYPCTKGMEFNSEYATWIIK
jgi:hypothetical protein